MAPSKTSRTKKPPPSQRSTTTVGGVAADLKVDELVLDALNPRLPESEQAGTPDDLIRFIAKEYSPIEIARSIASHGYFQSEPLIVVKEGGENVVVEGNRRLVALLLLTEPNKASELGLEDADEWKAISRAVALPEKIPVVVAPSRKAVAPIIGYRHISGIEPWDPYAKARYLAGLIDTDKHTFEDAASLVGETLAAVRTHYRNYRIAVQASKTFKADTSRARKRFGVFTRALQEENLRNFIQAPHASRIKTGKDPLPLTARAAVFEFLSWVFGDDDNKPILTDSRKLKDLGVAVSTEAGLKVLRSTRNLPDAFAAAGGPQKRLADQLREAIESLSAAEEAVKEYAEDAEVRDLVMQLEAKVKRLVDSLG